MNTVCNRRALQTVTRKIGQGDWEETMLLDGMHRITEAEQAAPDLMLPE